MHSDKELMRLWWNGLHSGLKTHTLRSCQFESGQSYQIKYEDVAEIGLWHFPAKKAYRKVSLVRIQSSSPNLRVIK